MNDFFIFRKKEKFLEDPSRYYPGLADPSMQPKFAQMINLASVEFEALNGKQDADNEHFKKLTVDLLKRFENFRDDLDKDDAEQVCVYIKELLLLCKQLSAPIFSLLDDFEDSFSDEFF